MGEGVPPREFLSVRNYDEFQHYRDRTPPWIKLYNAILDDYEFACLTDQQKWHLVAIWLLASRCENRIPNDARWIAKRINAEAAPDLRPLISRGFLVVLQEAEREAEQPASAPLAECSGDRTESGAFARSREGEREGETEIEGEQKPPCPEPDEPASGRCRAAAPVPDDPVVMDFPVIANGDAPWLLRGSKLAEYADTFPHLEVGPELRRARQWLIDNPAKRKTPKGMTRFLFAWLERRQNRGAAGDNGSARRAASPSRRPLPSATDAEALDSLVIRSGGDRG